MAVEQVLLQTSGTYAKETCSCSEGDNDEFSNGDEKECVMSCSSSNEDGNLDFEHGVRLKTLKFSGLSETMVFGVQLHIKSQEIRQKNITTHNNILVSDISKDSLCDKDGRLKINDRIISINNTTLTGLNQAREILADAIKNGQVVLTVSRSGENHRKQLLKKRYRKLSYLRQKKTPRKLHILKDSNDLGLKVVSQNSRIFISDILQNTTAQRDGRLEVGDELLEINGRSLVGFHQNSVLNLLNSSSRLIQLLINKKANDVDFSSSSDEELMHSPQKNSEEVGLKKFIRRKTVERKSPQDTKRISQESFIKNDSFLDQSSENIIRFSEKIFSSVTPTKLSNNDPGNKVISHNTDEINEKRKYHRSSSDDNILLSPEDHNALSRIQTPVQQRTFSVILVKGPNRSLGFTIVGGKDSPKGHMGIYVKSILEGGAAASDGRLMAGDEIVSVNRVSLHNFSHSEVVKKFKRLGQGIVNLEVRRPFSTSIPEHAPLTDGNTGLRRAASLQNVYKVPSSSQTLIKKIKLQKEKHSDLGFSIGCSGSKYNHDYVVYVQYISDNSIAIGKLQLGDEILSVNSEDFYQKTFEEAVYFLQKISTGPVTMVIRRPRAHVPFLLLDHESDYVDTSSIDGSSEMSDSPSSYRKRNALKKNLSLPNSFYSSQLREDTSIQIHHSSDTASDSDNDDVTGGLPQDTSTFRGNGDGEEAPDGGAENTISRKDTLSLPLSDKRSSSGSSYSNIPAGFDLHVVDIEKNPCESLGISLIPSEDRPPGFFKIRRVLSGSVCEKSGQFHVGDCLMSINGKDLQGMTHTDALQELKTPRSNVIFGLLRETSPITTVIATTTRTTTSSSSKSSHPFSPETPSSLRTFLSDEDYTSDCQVFESTSESISSAPTSATSPPEIPRDPRSGPRHPALPPPFIFDDSDELGIFARQPSYSKYIVAPPPIFHEDPSVSMLIQKSKDTPPVFKNVNGVLYDRKMTSLGETDGSKKNEIQPFTLPLPVSPLSTTIASPAMNKHLPPATTGMTPPGYTIEHDIVPPPPVEPSRPIPDIVPPPPSHPYPMRPAITPPPPIIPNVTPINPICPPPPPLDPPSSPVILPDTAQVTPETQARISPSNSAISLLDQILESQTMESTSSSDTKSLDLALSPSTPLSQDDRRRSETSSIQSPHSEITSPKELTKTPAFSEMVVGSRSEQYPFTIDYTVKKFRGLGMKVCLTSDGHVMITELSSHGIVKKDGRIKVGDYLLAVNDISLSGISLTEVSQLIKHSSSKGVVRLAAQAPPIIDGIDNKHVISAGNAHQYPDVDTSKEASLYHGVKLRPKTTEQLRRASKDRPVSEVLQTNNDLIDKETRKRMKKKSSVKARLGRVFGGRESPRTSVSISLPLEREDGWKKTSNVREEMTELCEVVDLSEKSIGSRESLVSPDSITSPSPLDTQDTIPLPPPPLPTTTPPPDTNIPPLTIAPSSTVPIKGDTISDKDTRKLEMNRLKVSNVKEQRDRSTGSESSDRSAGSSQRSKNRRKRRSIEFMDPPPPPPPPPEDNEEHLISYPRVPDGHECPPPRPHFLFDYPPQEQAKVQRGTEENNNNETPSLSPVVATKPTITYKPITTPKPVVSPKPLVPPKPATPQKINDLPFDPNIVPVATTYPPVDVPRSVNAEKQKSEIEDDDVFTTTMSAVAKTTVTYTSSEPTDYSGRHRLASLPTKHVVEKTAGKPRPQTMIQTSSKDEGIFSIQLLKKQSSLGLVITGGMDTPLGMLYIKEIQAESPAALCQRLHVGDQILQINGVNLLGATHAEALRIMRTTPPLVALVVARRNDRTEDSLYIDESLLKRKSPTRSNEAILHEAVVSSKITKETSNLVVHTSPAKSPNVPRRSEDGSASPRNKSGRITPGEQSDIPVSFIGGEDHEDHDESSRITKNEEGTILHVTLTKDPSAGVGISICGGKDSLSEDLMIRHIAVGSVTARDGRVKIGDKLLAVNGQPLKGMTNPQAVAFLRQTPCNITLTLLRPKKSSGSAKTPPPVAQKPPKFLIPKVEQTSETSNESTAWPVKEEKRKGLWGSISGSFHGSMVKKSVDIDFCDNDTSGYSKSSPTRKGIKDLFAPSEPTLMDIEVEQGPSGVGFSIRGGKDSIYGDSPIYVDSVFSGDCRATTLRTGDELVLVNGHDMSRMTHTDAVELLNSLPKGRVRLRLRRT